MTKGLEAVFASSDQITGLSTDTKPTSTNAGARFLESDTGDLLVFDDTYWWLLYPGPFTTRRTGWVQQGQSAVGGSGMLATLTAATGAGTQAFAYDNNNGRYLGNVTGAVSGNKGGYRTNIGTLVIRKFNPKLRVRFQLPAASDYTLSRGYIGFAFNAEPTGDDALNARNGFMVGWISGGTNFIAHRNDGVGATDVTGSIAPLDTAIHTVSLVGDEANSRFSARIDNNPYIHYTTEIPASTSGMAIIWANETNETAAKNLRTFNIFCQVDK